MFAPFLSFGQNIPMTFHNGSFSPIYLSIPGVMNPNLSPKSTSTISFFEKALPITVIYEYEYVEATFLFKSCENDE